ncbi:hypothetical protein ACTPOK_08425 [Streptomyces inhibens]|uniref:hypothetical protein n=1 Tax=Streptomyces inhibens TaxID=2293571 RepID=UPI00402B029F
MASQSSPAAAPSTADVLRQRYANRLATSLDGLTGPTHSAVELPLYITWPGLRTYNLHRHTSPRATTAPSWPKDSATT